MQDEEKFNLGLLPEMDAPIVNLQREVQRKLGRCMIRLQQYERLMKGMVASMALEGPPEQLQAIHEKQVACADTKTLGTLVGLFTGSYLRPAEREGVAEPVDDSADPELSNQGWFRTRHELSMPPERFEQTRLALAELVALRNDLVHHFLDRFDIFQEPGCRAADTHLDACFELIDGHALDLMAWARGMESARTLAESFMQTPQFEDALVHGIWPDGTVNWPLSTIVECLRDAEQACTVEGWTLLKLAVEHIRGSHPDQNPKRYGCSSWRHVIHESGHFEVRKEITAGQGIAVWYRSRLRGL